MNIRLDFPSPMRKFLVNTAVPRDTLARSSHYVGCAPVACTAPIELKPGDELWIDLRNGDLHIVERGGIAIWRSGWVN